MIKTRGLQFGSYFSFQGQITDFASVRVNPKPYWLAKPTSTGYWLASIASDPPTTTCFPSMGATSTFSDIVATSISATTLYTATGYG